MNIFWGTLVPVLKNFCVLHGFFLLVYRFLYADILVDVSWYLKFFCVICYVSEIFFGNFRQCLTN